MHYVRWHFGDFREAVRGCSLMERGAYAVLLEELYVHERPLPLDDEELLRLIGARGSTEERAILKMRDRFFQKSDGGFVQKRAQAEINAFREISHKKSEAGKLGAVARHKLMLGKNPSPAIAHAQAPAQHMPGQTSGTALAPLVNHQPLTRNQEPPAINQQPEQLPSTEPPAVEFPSGFPVSAVQAIAWARGGAVIIDRPDDWIRDVWEQTVARGFCDGANVRISSWTHYVGRRSRIDDVRDSGKGAPEKKDARRTNPLDTEPDGPWRPVLLQLATQRGIALPDEIADIGWRSVPLDLREAVLNSLSPR